MEGALSRNFAVTVVKDAVVGATDKSKEVALTKLAKQDILIRSSQQIFDSEDDKEDIRNDAFTTFN